MFSSVEALLQKASASEVQGIIVKYFTDKKPMPKDFSQHFPQFDRNEMRFFCFKPLEVKTVKKELAKCTSKIEVDKMLTTLFGLDEVIDPSSFQIFTKVNNITFTKANKAATSYLYRTAIRIFIKVVHQIPKMLTDILDNHKEMPSVFECLHRLLFFFSLYSGKKFLTFSSLLKLFLNAFSFRFDQILLKTTPTQVQEATLTFMGALVSVNRTYMRMYPNTPYFVTSFIVEQLDKIFVIMDASNLTKPIAISIRTVISSLVPDLASMQVQQCHDLGCVALSLIQAILKSNCLEILETYQTCVICLKLYNEACKFESSKIPKFQFAPVITFIIFIIKNCPDAILTDASEPNIPKQEPTELQPLDREKYFLNNDTIDDMQEMVISERLSQIGQLILQICGHYHDPASFVAHMIDSIIEQQSSITEEQYRTFVAFVLYLITRVKEETVNSAVNNNWSLLLSPIIFVPSVTAVTDVRLRRTVCNIVLRTFIVAPESRMIILKAISDYFKIDATAGRFYFLRLLRGLFLVDPSCDFSVNLSKSPLLDDLIGYAKISVSTFDFVRHIIFVNPNCMFQIPIVQKFIGDSMPDPVRKDTAIKLMNMGLESSDNTLLNGGLFAAAEAMRALKDDTDSALAILERVITQFESWPEEKVALPGVGDIIDAAGCIPQNNFSEEIFITIINQFLRMEKSPPLFAQMIKPERTAYRNLTEAAKNPHQEAGASKLLLSLAMGDTGGSKDKAIIRNYMGLEVLLEWCKGGPEEDKIMKRLDELGAQSLTNVHQMNNANVPEFIMRRLENVDEPKIAMMQLNLFSQLCKSSITIPTLNAAIRLMNSKIFSYQHMVLQMFFSLIFENPFPGPSCFFHFDGNSTGIFGPSLEMRENISVVTSFKIDEDSMNTQQPLLYFKGKSSSITICTNAHQIEIISQGNSSFNGSYKSRIEASRWYSVVFCISQKGIQMILNNKHDPQVLTPPIMFGEKYTLNIGTYGEGSKTSLIGDLGPIYVLKTTELAEIDIAESPNDTQQLYKKDILMTFSPITASKGKVVNVSPSISSVNFKGYTVPYVSTIRGVLSGVATMPNLIPILGRLHYCDECIGRQDKVCPHCHGLPFETGSRTLVVFFQLFSILLRRCEKVQQIFLTLQGFKLFSSFFMKINPAFFTLDALDALSSIFKELTIDDLNQSMVEDIWLNFDFVLHLLPQTRKLYLENYLPVLYKAHKEAFTMFPSLDFVLYRVIKAIETDESVGHIVWPFIQILFVDSASPGLCTTIVSQIGCSKDSRIIYPLLEILIAMMKQKTSIISAVLNIFEGYMPMALSFGSGDMAVKEKTIEAMSLLICDKIHSYLMIMITVLPEDSDFETIATKLTPYLFNSNRSFKQAVFFPLFAYCMLQLPVEIAEQYYSDVNFAIAQNDDQCRNLVKIPNWYWWLLELAFYVIHPTNERSPGLGSIATIMLPLLERSLSMGSESLEGTFQYLDYRQLVSGVDFRSIKKLILSYLMSKKVMKTMDKTYDRIFRLAFKLLFVQTSLEGVEFETDEVVHPILQNVYKKHNISTKKAEFAILIEDGKWVDIDIAPIIVHSIKITPEFEFEVIEDAPMNSVTAYAYIAYNIARYDHTSFKQLLPMFISKFPSFSYDAAFSAANILVDAINKFNVSTSHCEKLTSFANNYVDEVYSPCQETFNFESTLGFETPKILATVKSEQNNFFKHIIERIEELIGINKDTVLDLSKHSLTEAIMSCGKTSTAKTLWAANDRFNTQQETALSGWHMRTAKHETAFMRELSLGGGPWADELKEKHFKASSIISSSGARVLLTLNQRFSDHRQASSLRDSGVPEAEKVTLLPKFRPVSIGPLTIKHEGFRAHVERIAPRKVTEGELTLNNGLLVYEVKKNREDAKRIEIKDTSIEFVLCRKQDHIDAACEVFTNDGKSQLFVFGTHEERQLFMAAIAKLPMPPQGCLRNHTLFAKMRTVCGCRIQNIEASEMLVKMKLTEKWSQYKITTFEYLYALNLLSGRSYNDLTQYPVFPWVLADYTSHTLTKTPQLRDLTEPIGALNQERYEGCLALYNEITDESERCLYRTHYSSLAGVSSYLIRMEPFTSVHIALQEGRFDTANRLFFSLYSEWRSINTDFSSVRELIPEFFCFPPMLENLNGFNLGIRSENNEPVDDVLLPPWASSPNSFVERNRMALESDPASANINKWIDLIFGVARHSFERKNIFHPLSYPDLDHSGATSEKIHNHCANFGVCPDALFFAPHPQRQKFKLQKYSDITLEQNCIGAAKGIFMLEGGDVLDSRVSPPVRRSCGQLGKLLAASRSQGIIVLGERFDPFVTAVDIERGQVQTISHDYGTIRACTIAGGEYLVTAGSDCSIRVWELYTMSVIRISTLHAHPVVAVAACADCGIVASVDIDGVIILETLRSGRFINSFEIGVCNAPRLLCFKSGLIAVLTDNSLRVFDCMGRIVASIPIHTTVKDVKKVTDERGRELIVLQEDMQLRALNLCELKEEANIMIKDGSSISTVRRQRMIAVASGRKVTYVAL